MDNFDFEKWSGLSVTERVDFCRTAARLAERDANTDPRLSDLYRDLAASWHRLAAELEGQDNGSS